MGQLQFYKYAALGLLLLNVAVLGFVFFWGSKPPPPRGGGERIAADILHLDEQQHDTFLSLAADHIELMNGFDEQQRTILKQYFEDVTAPERSTNTDNLLSEILQRERSKIESTHQHLRDVKGILRPEQERYFDEFVTSALNIILIKKKNPK